jgi:cyclase
MFQDIAASKSERQMGIYIVNRLYLPSTIGRGIRTMKYIQEIFHAKTDKISQNPVEIKILNVIPKVRNHSAISVLCTC